MHFQNSCFLPLQIQLYLAHWYAQRTWHFCVRGSYSEQTATVFMINRGFALQWGSFPYQSLHLWIFYWFCRRVILALLSWVKHLLNCWLPSCAFSLQGNTLVLHVGSRRSATPVPRAHSDRVNGKTTTDWLSPGRLVFCFHFVSVYSKMNRRQIWLWTCDPSVGSTGCAVRAGLTRALGCVPFRRLLAWAVHTQWQKCLRTHSFCWSGLIKWNSDSGIQVEQENWETSA